SFSEEDNRDSLKNITQKKVFKISAETIVSLEVYLSKEKFDLLKTQIIDKEFSQQTLDLVDKLSQSNFTDEEIQYVRQSIQFYFEILEKINVIAPLVYSLHEIKQKIEKIEDALDSLMEDEKIIALEKIKQLETQLESYRNSFKIAVQESGLRSINFNKLPGMLLDLGYDESFYQVIYVEFSSYLSVAKKLDAAESILKSMKKISDNIDVVELELKKSETREQKAIIATNLQKLVENKNLFKQDFTLNVTGIDVTTLEEKKDDKIDWEKELKKIFSPVIINLKNFTEPTRKIELLHTNIAIYEQQLPKMEKAVEQINILLLESQNSEVKKKLLLEKDFWVQREKELNTKFEVAKQQLLELESHKITTSEAFDVLAETIFSEQGKNILVAILVFFLTFAALHLLRRFVLLINPFNYIPKFKFVANLVDVILYILTFVISILTLMVTLYMLGSMLALAIVAIVLVSMLWTLRNTLPHFIEQIKLLLGYGPVRQGELVIHDGIPWLVESIGIFSYLKNSLLTGGTLRLPIKDLIDMRSRPYSKDETWFPCEEGDSVLINHKGWRKVIQITPQRIKFEWYGMEETMPTSQFLSQKIFNLSNTPFWVGCNLYISYEHRFELFNKIKKLEVFVGEEFKKTALGKYLITPWVDYLEMIDTSLGIMVWVQLTVEGAEQYDDVKLNLNKICFMAANKYGWEIKRFYAIEQYQSE
ncbi:MAG: hypothetical protein IMF12_06470, partial [Proteobacteria bacterium]|nr:hypothetical protein [Pseudomonadota bacterium]